MFRAFGLQVSELRGCSGLARSLGLGLFVFQVLSFRVFLKGSGLLGII